MNKQKYTVFILVFSIVFIHCFSTVNFAYTPKNIENTVIAKHIRVVTKGLVCSFCAQGIKKGLESHPATVSVQFNKDFNLVDIHLKEKKSIDKKDIVKIFNDSGYEVQEIIVNPKK